MPSIADAMKGWTDRAVIELARAFAADLPNMNVTCPDGRDVPVPESLIDTILELGRRLEEKGESP